MSLLFFSDLDEVFENILHRQRRIIDRNLRGYAFHPTVKADRYEDLQPSLKGSPVRNMIVTTWRSGSTFLGKLPLVGL